MIAAEKLRELTIDQLVKKEQDLRKELFNLRYQHATHQLENTSKISSVRRDIARVLTVLREKKTEEAGEQ